MTRRNGFVLVAVLWLCVGLAAALLDVTIQLRMQRLAAINVTDRIKLEAAVDGASERWLANMEATVAKQAAEQRPIQLLETTQIDSVGQTKVAITAYDAQSRWNPNRNGRSATLRFLQPLSASATEITDALADWIDSDDLTIAGPLEIDAYRPVQELTRPVNRPLAESQELCSVAYVDKIDCRRILPLTTTMSDGRININTASIEVLNALPGFSPAVSTALVMARSNNGQIPDLPAFISTLPNEQSSALLALWEELLRSSTMQTSSIVVGFVAKGPASLSASETLVVEVSNGTVLVSRRIKR